MKKLIIIPLLLLLGNNLMAQSSNEVILINQNFHRGSSTYVTIIGTNKEDVNNIKKKFDIVFSNSSFILDARHFQKIRHFIEEKCKNKYSEAEESFVIQIFGNSKKMSCDLENNYVAEPYYNDLIHLINDKSCMGGCKDLLVELKKTQNYLITENKKSGK